MGIIYKLINNINNKIYIGQTRLSLNTRFKHHLSSYKSFKKGLINYESKLYSAMIKYGPHNFSIIKIEDIQNELLNEREKYWIKKLNSIDQGYNINAGGFGGPLFKGHTHSLTTKLKMSKLRKGKKQSKDFIQFRTRNLCKIIQNLNTGEIYYNIKELNGKRRYRIFAAISLGGKTEGCFWIFVPKHLKNGYSFSERQSLINKLEDNRLKRRLEGIQKRSKNLNLLSNDEKVKRRIKFNLIRKNQWKKLSKEEYNKRLLELHHYHAIKYNYFLNSLGIENIKNDYLINKLSYKNMLIKYKLKPSSLDKLLNCLNLGRKK